MRRTILAGAVAGTALLAGSGGAFAQAIVVEPPGVYVAPVPRPAPDYYYEYYDDPPPAPRVYRYYRYYSDPDDAVVVRPGYRGGCGAYRYWDGERCVSDR
jgi:hypothetical protein